MTYLTRFCVIIWTGHVESSAAGRKSTLVRGTEHNLIVETLDVICSSFTSFWWIRQLIRSVMENILIEHYTIPAYSCKKWIKYNEGSQLHYFWNVSLHPTTSTARYDLIGLKMSLTSDEKCFQVIIGDNVCQKEPGPDGSKWTCRRPVRPVMLLVSMSARNSSLLSSEDGPHPKMMETHCSSNLKLVEVILLRPATGLAPKTSNKISTFCAWGFLYITVVVTKILHKQFMKWWCGLGACSFWSVTNGTECIRHFHKPRRTQVAGSKTIDVI